MQCLGGQLIDEHKRWSTSAKDLLRSKDALRQNRNGKPLHITRCWFLSVSKALYSSLVYIWWWW